MKKPFKNPSAHWILVFIEEAIQKSIRSLDIGLHGFEYVEYDEHALANPTDERLFQLYSALKDGMEVPYLAELTKMDEFFIYKIKNIVDFEATVTKDALDDVKG